MQGHVRFLAWLNIGFGVFGIGVGLALLAGGALLTEFVQGVADDAGLSALVVQVIAIIAVSLVVIFTLPCFILGYGLLNFRPWARVLGIVMAGLNLLNVPIGTVVSVYAIWVLLKPETEDLFRATPAISY